MSKICIIEDDEKIRNEISIFLNKNGYETNKIKEFGNVIDAIFDSKSDLLLLDINLPNYDGYYICREVRKKSDIPIIIVTSRNTEMDELMSINYGADHFVTKPYNTQILLAKIESILRRVDNKSNSSLIEYKNMSLDISKSMLSFKNNSIELTKNEVKILHYLLTNIGKIVSRDQIMTYLWDSNMFVDDNTLTVNINRLRRKLEDIGLVDIIETRRGQGYIIL